MSEATRCGEDDGAVFGGGDEDPLYCLGDADGLCGGASDLGTSGGGRERRSPIGAELMHFFDDGLRWGKRRPDERSLNFMDGGDCASLLGDGEDLP